MNPEQNKSIGAMLSMDMLKGIKFSPMSTIEDGLKVMALEQWFIDQEGFEPNDIPGAIPRNTYIWDALAPEIVRGVINIDGEEHPIDAQLVFDSADRRYQTLKRGAFEIHNSYVFALLEMFEKLSWQDIILKDE